MWGYSHFQVDQVEATKVVILLNDSKEPFSEGLPTRYEKAFLSTNHVSTVTRMGVASKGNSMVASQSPANPICVSHTEGAGGGRSGAHGALFTPVLPPPTAGTEWSGVEVLEVADVEATARRARPGAAARQHQRMG
ncbi:hypothetical protein MHYP_G00156920 [Metynnis hypsauchen]